MQRSVEYQTPTLLRDQAGLPSGWSLEREAPSLAHRLHCLLNGEQLGRLVRFEVPWAHGCQGECGGSAVIGQFSEPNDIVLPIAEVEAAQASTELLGQFPDGDAAVLRV